MLMRQVSHWAERSPQSSQLRDLGSRLLRVLPPTGSTRLTAGSEEETVPNEDEELDSIVHLLTSALAIISAKLKRSPTGPEPDCVSAQIDELYSVAPFLFDLRFLSFPSPAARKAALSPELLFELELLKL